jgi:hypothetical protein
MCTLTEIVCFNDNDAFVPEQWAMEGLVQLEELMVVSKLVHRDFENSIQKFGDVVNTRKPGEFKIQRKVDGDTLAHQAAASTNVQVKLDQWFYNSFVIFDGEQSKSFKELVEQYLVPSMRVIARSADRAVLGRSHELMANKVGRLASIAASTCHEWVLDARETLNRNLAPQDEARSLLLAPTSETAMLKNSLFIKANERGDGGAALENARLGRIFGFNTFAPQNVSSVRTGADVATGTSTNALAAGATGSLTVSVAGYVSVVGEYANIAGNDQPNVLTAVTAVTNTTAMTLDAAIKYATGAGAVVTVYKSCAVKGDYALGYSKGIILDGYTATKGPQIGQLVAFSTGATRKVYTVIEASENAAGTEMTVTLDRPLERALANDDVAFPGPMGDMNLALHRDCLALVCRPLAIPRQGAGVMSGAAVYNDIPMRVQMQYDINIGGTIVNCDMLAGVALLDAKLGCLLLG